MQHGGICYSKMDKIFTLHDGKYGVKAVIRGSPPRTIAEDLIRSGVVELELNRSKGWSGDDVTFLNEMHCLQSVEIIDMQIRDVQPIHSLLNLRRLRLLTYCQTPINFALFPMLTDCGMEWRRGCDSLFDCESLQMLYLNGYDGENLTHFIRLSRLESLILLNAKITNLRGISHLSNLKFLRLGNLKQLTSISDLSANTRLEHLEIQRCRNLKNIDPLSALTNLRVLHLNDDGILESLGPIRVLGNLKEVLFYETTNIADGDLGVLMSLPKLRKVSFQDRRHYSHRRVAFNSFENDSGL